MKDNFNNIKPNPKKERWLKTMRKEIVNKGFSFPVLPFPRKIVFKPNIKEK